MQLLPFVYLGYMFISLYFLSLFLIIYFKNRRNFFDYPEPKKKYSVSFLVPVYNEEKTIGYTLKHIIDIGYDNIVEILVINDGSKDNSKKVIEEYAKKYPIVKLTDKTNSGKADSLNYGLKHAKGELVAVVDADSYPAKGSINKMVGFFDSEKVGVVTCPVLARNARKFWEKMQAIEYKVIAFSRKLLEYVDAIYVTPGPLALYRKTALEDIGGFDKDNMTEDIEATWHLTKNGWDRKMSLSTNVSSTVPTKLKPWYKQRRRWNIGGLQCMYKYRKSFGKNGMLGYFILPFFIFSTFLGLVGLSIFGYVLLRNMVSNFIFTRYSIIAETPVLTMDDFYITLSFLNYLGITLFIVGFIFTIVVLAILKEKILIKENFLNIPFYLTIYLILYPFILVDSIWHTFTGKYSWR